MRNNREYLFDIIEAIERIEKYTDQGYEVFEQDELVQSWIIHHLQVIGEAVNGLSKDFRNHNKAVPWKKIIGMRNILVHHYFGIDKSIVWKVVERELPILKRNILKLLNNKR